MYIQRKPGESINSLIRRFTKASKGIVEECKRRKSFIPESHKKQNKEKRYRKRIFVGKLKGRQ